MTVDDWVFEAIEKAGTQGATLRDIQRSIDEHRFEELATDTIEASLAVLVKDGRIALEVDRWRVQRQTSKADALKRLFGDS
jgi:hypothetical protein